ncbi:MAG: type VI secretion system tip protein VgrG [Sandaracinaceae bacterium]|nr:type VI secretion system tip protein VgrG [Sandaracinaceae bacterium]
MAEIVNYALASDALEGMDVMVRSVRFVEALDEPFHVDLNIAVGDPDADLMTLLGKNATLTLVRAGIEHPITGVIVTVTESDRAAASDHPSVDLVVEPALSLLRLRRNTRMFQNKTVPEILEIVLGEALSVYEREARIDVSDTYVAREYCLQYQESDYDFVHRLMQEEGISYHFDHSGEKEVMVLSDSNDAFQLAPTVSSSVPYEPHDMEARDADAIHVFQAVHRDTTTAVAVRDFDWTQAAMPISDQAEGEDARGRVRESYQHGLGRELRIVSYDQGARRYQEHDAARQKGVRREAAVRGAILAHGTGRAAGFEPGKRFTLSGHPSPGLDGEYILLRVEHLSMSASQALGREGGSGEPYHNRFLCMPVATVHRPARSFRKPSIEGVQTAVVTGPAGEEIHVDEHGRIKVQFHWDRESPADETSSCWIRVKQEWAGAGWGFWWVPRIGMEVVVHFIDGDPDRPLVTGAVYDGTNALPYPLPDEKTKSTIKSSSSLGGGGFNEFRFEDKAGSEEIFTHAQKDYNEVVENNHDTLVHHDQTNTVDGHQKQTIHANQTERVDGAQDMSVGGDRTVHVEGNFDETVDGTETRHVAGDVTETFDASETRAVGAALTETISGNETRTIGASQSESISAAHTLTIGGNQSLTVTGSLTQSVDGGITTITPASFSATAAGGWSVKADGGITFIAPAGATIVAPGGVGRVDFQWNTTAGAEKADSGAVVFEFYVTKTEAYGLALDFVGFRMTDDASDDFAAALRGGLRMLKAWTAAMVLATVLTVVEPAQKIEA